MKKILEIILNFLKKKNVKIIAIVLAIILFLSFILYLQHNKIRNLKEKYQSEVKLRDALLDSVGYYQNKENEWVAEKLTIQESVKNLEKINDQLTDQQRELMKRVKEIEKTNSIIAAALIQTNVKIDSLKHKGETIVDTTGKKITFSDLHKEGNKEVSYKFIVGNVLPARLDLQPSFFIDSLYFPNKQFVEFHWKNERKRGYPVTFSVSNSNGYFTTTNIDSYAIPEINKLKINPNGWQKVGNFLIKNGKIITYIAIGGVGGAGTYYLLSK